MTRHTLRLSLAVLIGLGVHAASAQPALEGRIIRLTGTLDLDATQQARLSDIAADYADADRAGLWAAAAALEDVLTDDQIQQLRESARTRRSDRRARRGDRSRARRGRARRGVRNGPDEQREALRALRDQARDRRADLVSQLRDGTIRDAEFVSQLEALRATSRAQVQQALPQGLAARFEERHERREAAQAARESALGLTEAQKDRLQALRLDRLRARPADLDVRPFLDDEGRLDRRALREARRDQREALRPQREATREAMRDVLTDEQQTIVALHHALVRPRGRAGRQGR